ncbi:MAG: glycosyltransferase family 2 protein [Mariniphaga sp.]|nr:glycosyltransferase family 2 protein [Mariniphaga sp.]
MRLSIVILNWNGCHHLRRFLPSVLKYSNYDWAEIVVADNYSSDESREVVEKEFPNVKYLQLDRNYGFAEGYNRALKNNEAEYILLLNSDVEVTGNWLEPMLKIMDSNPLIGACQPKIMQLEHPEKFEYAGASGGFIDHYGYPFCRGRIVNFMEQDLGQYDLPISVFWASGAAILVRGKLWHEFEGFDADFWAHMEEIDLCWRMKNRGFKIAVCPQSKVFHLGGGSLSYGSPQKIYLNFRNNLFLLYKNLPKEKFYKIMFLRMILDGVAALQFLITGQFTAFTKVPAAHRDFYKSLGRLRKKRKVLLSKVVATDHPEIYKGSIIFDFFISKKRKFSSLKFPANEIY